MSTSSAADGNLVERFHMTGAQLAFMTVALLPLLGFAAVLVSVLRRGPAMVAVISGGLTTLFLLLGVLLVVVVLRPLTLTETALLLPRVFRSYRRVALVDVALQLQGRYGPLAVDGVKFRDNEAAPGSRYAARAYWSPVEAVGIGCPPPGR